MKTLKIILIFSVIISLLSSCDYEAQDWDWEVRNPNYVNKTFFSPPDWIIGKWESKPTDDSELRFVYEFTSDNIIDPYLGDRNKGINDWNRSTLISSSLASVKETKTDSTYITVTQKLNRDYDQFKFQKIDENTIIVLEGYVEGQRVLYKLEY